MIKDRLSLEAVAFTTEALLALMADQGEPDQPRPGARRVVDLLERQGLRTGVMAGPEPARDETAERLARIGLGHLPLLQVIPDGGAPVVGLTHTRSAGEPAAPQRVPASQTLVVSGPTDPLPAGHASSFAGSVVARPDQPLAAPLHTWLAARLGAIDAATALTCPLDAVATRAAYERHASLTKPPGSLGRIEDLGIQLAGISGQVPPPPPRPATVAVFAGDHGVHAQGVSPWPQDVTGQMALNFLAGGAAINVLATQAQAEVVVVDVGMLDDVPPAPGLLRRKVARGTRDLTQGPAMTSDEARQAVEVGIDVAAGLVAQGFRCLLTGDMGIANTTPAAALIVALTHRRAGDATGRGSGLQAADVPRKASIVAEAAARARRAHGDDVLGILSEVGGLEHAALAGYILGGAALGVPVVIDGAIAASALLVASRLAPGLEGTVIAGHRSAEPGASVVLETLGLEPVVDLNLRLGEGTGAVLVLPLIEAAAAILGGMTTFDQAGVSAKGLRG